jgi:hypothetical protein
VEESGNAAVDLSFFSAQVFPALNLVAILTVTAVCLREIRVVGTNSAVELATLPLHVRSRHEQTGACSARCKNNCDPNRDPPFEVIHARSGIWSSVLHNGSFIMVRLEDDAQILGTLDYLAIRIRLCLKAHSRPDSSSSISVFMSAP